MLLNGGHCRAYTTIRLFAVLLLIALITSCGGSGGGGDSNCFVTDIGTVEDLDVAEDETYCLNSSGKYEFLNLEVNGRLRVDANTVEIHANKITIGKTGVVDARAKGRCGDDPGEITLSDGRTVSLIAEIIETSGTISASGGAHSCSVGGFGSGRTSNGGNVLLDADSISFTGTINVPGGNGFIYSCFPAETCSISGGNGGSVTFSTRIGMPILSGRIFAKGGDGGGEAFNVGGAEVGSGGNGGSIRLDPPGAFPDLTVEIDGGAPGACSDCMPPPSAGAPGVIIGLL